MKTRDYRGGRAIGLLLAGVLAGAAGVIAQTRGSSMPVVLEHGSTLWLEGTSTMHDYVSRTSDVSLAFARDSIAAEPVDAAGIESLMRQSKITGLEVEVPIASMHSGKSGLDKNLQKSLRADKFPAIRFHLSHYTLKPDGAARDTFGLELTGTLTVAGQERPALLTARAYRAAQGVWVEGSQNLLMSEFDIRPPTMMLGALKVGDRVTVHYRLLVATKVSAPGPTSGRTN